MKRKLRFALWLAVLFGGIVAVVAAVLALVVSGSAGDGRRILVELLVERAPILVFVGMALIVFCGTVVGWLLNNYVTAASVLAEQTRIIYSANRDHRVTAEGGAELGELAAAINRLGDAYRAQQADLESKIAESGLRLEEERNRLAALMSELSQGVLLCNPEGRILLYNEQARALFAGAASGERHSMVGLGRSVFALLDRDQVAHALDKIHYRLGEQADSPLSSFLTTTAAGTLLKVQLAPYLSSGDVIAGMVLALEDVTEAFAQEGRRRSLLQALAGNVRRPAANIRAAAENLVSYPEMTEAQRAQFAGIIVDESHRLSQSIDTALREHADALKAELSLEDMPVADLINVARRHISAVLDLAVGIEAVDETIWIKVDSYAFVQVLASLAMRLRDEYAVREIRFRVAVADGFMHLDLVWTGAIVATDALAFWETEPMQGGADPSALTIRDVLERHGGEVWRQAHGPTHTAWFRFLLPLGKPGTPRRRRAVAASSRPEYYDFDLFDGAETAQGLLEQRLADLSYTAFDTETTGLEPSAGDEIISIGAVRIVNGRLLKQEVFEQLIDPQRPIARESAAIHGIRSADLAGQPLIGVVLPSFHRFCADTILVAHNGAFDMRFLEMKEAATGVRFAQPVLDTLLLSAVVHPNLADHRLEGIAERMGLTVIGRHTALGDALVTGEIFLKLVPLLAERGIFTLGQALDASRETYHARLQY